jgi:DNA adenine methylase
MLTQLRPPIAPRPFLKWAGGKGQLIAQYLPYFPQKFRTYYEPFLGGGAVFFHLQPQRAWLVDVNAELVNVYLCVRDRVEELIDQLAVHKQQHSFEHYYAVRSQTVIDQEWFVCGHNVERAARLIYLNKTCFNGLYRENSKGHFNVPMGSYKNPIIYEPTALRGVAERLKSATIAHDSFDAVLGKAKTHHDFVYFDPPYYPISATSKFTSYNRYSFHEADQVRLRDTFTTLAQRGVKVMLSNSDCPFIRDLYSGFTVHTIYASRNINSKADKRGKITEVLVTANIS